MLINAFDFSPKSQISLNVFCYKLKVSVDESQWYPCEVESVMKLDSYGTIWIELNLDTVTLNRAWKRHWGKSCDAAF